MTATNKNDLLFDDIAMLKQQFNHRQLMASSVNANCDCAGSPLNTDCDRVSSPSLNANCDCVVSPSISRYDDRNPRQISAFIGQAD